MIIAALAIALTAGSQTPTPFLKDPDIHGNQVVFCCEGDLWLGDLDTRQARRLTRDEGREFGPRFSPDGSQIAFTGQYDGADEVYVMPTAGGPPRRLTYRNQLAECLAWTPDGKDLLVRMPGVPASYEFHLVPKDGGFPQRMPIEFAAHGSFGTERNLLAFTRFNRAANAWFRYQGGLKNAIWLGDLAAKRFKAIAEGSGTCEYPTFCGERVYYVEENDAKFTIKSVPKNGGSSRPLVGPSDFEIRNLQTDGARLVYERGRGLELADPAAGKPERLEFELHSDLLHTRPYRAVAQDFAESATLTATGKRVLVATRGQIVTLPSSEGEAKVLLAKAGVRYGLATQSPDAKSLAYVSDETGEQQLYVGSADGSNPKQLTKDQNRQIRAIRWSPDSQWIALTDSETRLRLIKSDGSADTEIAKGQGWDGPGFDFSPDSKWVAYEESDRFTFFRTITLYEIATGKRTTLGSGMADDSSPTFSKDGKWLAFLSVRQFAPRWDGIQNLLATLNAVRPMVLALRKDTPSPFAAKNDEEKPAPEKKEEPKEEPFRIDIEGLYGRLFELPMPPGTYSRAAFAGDRLFMLNADEGGTKLDYYDLKSKGAGSYGATTAYNLSSDQKKLLLGAGGTLRVVDATATQLDANAGRVSFGGLQLEVEPVAEWKQIYWEAWRFLRDYFYVKNMHGADWPAMGKKYEPYLASVRSRGELDELIRWLQAELGISHAFLATGDTQTKYKANPAGFLGIDVEPDPSGTYRIKRILRGDGLRESERSPLVGPGLDVREGDLLIEVAGIPAKVGQDWQAGLVGRAGQIVSVFVNDKPGREGARTAYVKPIASERRLRYLSWVQANRDYVAKATGGKVGYIHLAAMVQQDVADFLRQYFPQRNKDAVVMDVRYNSGGNVSDQIATILKQRVQIYWNQRNNPTYWTRQSDYFPGPVVCLINEFNYSDGEEFPYQFRKLDLGTIIGRRTRGGEVGSDPGWRLMDGGLISVPNYGAWTPEEGWIIERTGVSPDIDVPSDPNLYAQSKDPQLDRAIAELQKQLKAHPAKRPVPPPDPVHIKPGKGGT